MKKEIYLVLFYFMMFYCISCDIINPQRSRTDELSMTGVVFSSLDSSLLESTCVIITDFHGIFANIPENDTSFSDSTGHYSVQELYTYKEKGNGEFQITKTIKA